MILYLLHNYRNGKQVLSRYHIIIQYILFAIISYILNIIIEWNIKETQILQHETFSKRKYLFDLSLNVLDIPVHSNK